MPTVTIVLVDKPRKDGKWPIRLRLTIARKNAYETIGYCHPRHYLATNQSVRYSEPMASELNKAIQRRRAEVEALVDLYTAEKWSFTPQQVLAIPYEPFMAERAKQPDERLPSSSFVKHARLLIELKLAAGRYTSAKRYTTYLTTLLDYLTTLRRTDLELGEVSDEFLTAFFAHLRNKEHLPNGDNTLHRRFGWFKTVLHDAHKEGLISKMPYRRFKTRPVKTGKTKLSQDEIEQIARLAEGEYGEIKEQLALRLRIFLLQFYLYGTRISDVLTLKNHHLIRTGGQLERVEFRQRKTDKFMSIRTGAAASALLERYAKPHQPDHFVFGWLKWEVNVTQSAEKNQARLEEEIESKTAMVNEALKEAARRLGISKHLSTHVARHSFAMQMKRKNKPIQAIKQALGHTKISQTEVYLDDLDSEELDSILGDAYD